jgi:nicotinic acid mononucleotide adenylyltransferase
MASANKSKKAYFMFGRFNPPTIGHGSIFRKLIEDAKAKKDDQVDVFVFVSSTQDLDKNPLPVERKMHYLKTLYGKLGIHFVNTTTCELGPTSGPCTGPVQIIDRLREMGYKELSMYVGSDRVDGFQWIPKRNKIQGITYPVQIVNAMPARTKNDFVAGMSASKIREAARSKDPEMDKMVEGTDMTQKQKIVSDGTGLSKDDVDILIGEICNPPKPVKSLKQKSHTNPTRRRALSERASNRSRSRSRSRSKNRRSRNRRRRKSRSISRSPRSHGGYQTRKSKK